MTGLILCAMLSALYWMTLEIFDSVDKAVKLSRVAMMPIPVNTVLNTVVQYRDITPQRLTVENLFEVERIDHMKAVGEFDDFVKYAFRNKFVEALEKYIKYSHEPAPFANTYHPMELWRGELWFVNPKDMGKR